MNKALFWDFDGTLSYPNRSFETALYNAITECGYDVDKEKTCEWLSKAYSWKMPDITYPDKTGEGWWDVMFERINAFIESHGVKEADFRKVDARFRELLIDVGNYRLYDDTEETLKRARELGYKIYLVTNNYPEITENLEKLGISAYFDGMIISAHIGYEKPRKEFFDYAKTMAGNPEIGYMIGDNPNADIKGGKSAGLTTIAVHECRESVADYYIENLADIFALLK